MQLAAAFTSYAEETDLDLLDKAYGQLNFRAYGWSDETTDTFTRNEEILAKHPCSREELSLEES